MIYARQILYSLQALGYLALLPQNRAVKVKELATKLDIPKHYLGKVLTSLAKKKFVSSTKGPSGGFTLTVNASNITIYRILATLNGLGKLEDRCIMGLDICNSQNPCALHDLWGRFKEEAVERTQKLTLSEFAESVYAKADQVTSES